MRAYCFPLTILVLVLALAFAFPSRAAEKPRPAQGSQNQSKKIWSNDDMDQLRARGLISIIGQEFQDAATQAPVMPAGLGFPVYNSRLEDPEWYAEKAAQLQAELDRREAALREEQTAIALAVDRITAPGVALDQPSVGVTPQAGIAILEAQVNEVQNELFELSDLARENNIPPGVLRG